MPCGRVEVALRKDETVPQGWGVDSEGLPSTDPKAILFGGGLTYLGGAEEVRG